MSFPVSILPKNARNCVPGKIKVFSPAKINIYLNIIGKYSNGFHKIESIVNRISLFDEITIATNLSGKVSFSCNRQDLVRDNLCLKAVAVLKEKYSLDSGFDIYLKKNIPLGSGLGGGSSNAAYTILSINRLLNLGLSTKELMKLGAKLGSDVNFFLLNTSWAYLSGRGDVVKPLDIMTKFSYFLVYPNRESSTSLVYQKAKSNLTKFINNVNMLIYALKKKDYILVDKLSFNCLEKSTAFFDKTMGDVRRFFRKRGIYCHLSGSGSAFFTLLRDNSFRKKMEITNLIFKIREKGWLAFRVHSW